MAIVSRAEKDGAYGDDHSASIEIYKQAACTYWYLDNDQVLRWYAKGYDAPAAAPSLASWWSSARVRLGLL